MKNKTLLLTVLLFFVFFLNVLMHRRGEMFPLLGLLRTGRKIAWRSTETISMSERIMPEGRRCRQYNGTA